MQRTLFIIDSLESAYSGLPSSDNFLLVITELFL